MALIISWSQDVSDIGYVFEACQIVHFTAGELQQYNKEQWKNYVRAKAC